MIRLGVGKVGQEVQQALDSVADGERCLLQVRGKDVAGLIPVRDLLLLEELEDQLDAQAADLAEEEAARKGEQPLSWDEVKATLRF